MAPAQKPHRSKQDYRTPTAFIRAVEARFGELAWDLACSRENRVAELHFAGDALQEDWGACSGNLWCNPPFGDITRWADKMADECRTRPYWAFLLVPASIGANWFAEHVRDQAMVLGLSPRLTFQGCSTPYIKDLMLCAFGFRLRGFDTWRWT